MVFFNENARFFCLPASDSNNFPGTILPVFGEKIVFVYHTT